MSTESPSGPEDPAGKQRVGWWAAGQETTSMGKQRPKPRTDPGPGASQPRPWVAPSASTAGIRVRVAQLVVMVAGVVMMVGSVTTWVSVSLAGHTVSVAGTAGRATANLAKGDGWVTFSFGAVVVVMGGLGLVSKGSLLRLITSIVAMVGLGFAIYYVVHVLNAISKFHASVGEISGGAFAAHAQIGFGLIMVLAAAAAATLAALIELRSS